MNVTTCISKIHTTQTTSLWYSIENATASDLALLVIDSRKASCLWKSRYNNVQMFLYENLWMTCTNSELEQTQAS